MSVTINIHDAAFGSRLYEAREGRPPYAALEVTFDDHSKAHVYLNDLAKCDALIKAACAAKDMLAAHQHAATMTDPLAPLRDREHYEASVEAANDEAAYVPMCEATHPGKYGGVRYTCTEPLGHEPEDHVAMGGGRECCRWPAAPERTATAAEHADTADRIERAEEITRICKLHDDGHITAAECAGMRDKVLGENA